jgi:4-hydroxybenzoate polyprenyltransferase
VRGVLVNTVYPLFAGGRIDGWIVAFFSVVASLIAVIKDVPDTKGDSCFNISTFARCNREAVLDMCTCAGVGLGTVTLAFHATASCVKQALVCGLLSAWALISTSTENENDAVKRLYRFLWTVFCVSYLGLLVN